MGGLCCVACRPPEENSGKGAQERSMDLVEPQWRTNFSFSPPAPSRIWDCRLQTDTLLSRPGHLVHGTSKSSYCKERRIVFGGGRRTNHQHSVSDGFLSYSGSQPDGQAPRWTSPIRKLGLDGFSTPSITGKMSSRPEIAWVPQSSEGQHGAYTHAASCSYGSPFSLSESGPGDLPGGQPSTIFQSCNFPSRCSFMSKPVYPVLIHNPVSDCDATGGAETCSIGRLTPDNDTMLPLTCADNIGARIEQEFQTSSQLQGMDASPDPSSISRREGYRWSTSSSYDMEFDAEQIDISENIDVDNLRSPIYQMDGTKCGVCVKFLRQKSPWGSNRIMRSGDFPVAGVLPCSHVFHAECLEQVTPKSQIHDPPCPLCSELSADSKSYSEPLIMALNSVRRRGVTISDTPENFSIDGVLNFMKVSTLKITSSARSRPTSSNKFRKHLSSKGKLAKNFFIGKVLRRT